jgi:cytochrome c
MNHAHKQAWSIGKSMSRFFVCASDGPDGLIAKADSEHPMLTRSSTRPSVSYHCYASTLASWSASAVLILSAVEMAAAQDAAAGEKVFVQCRACHQVGEKAKNAVGPHLNGLFTRKAGTVQGYSYSPANKNSGLMWDEATFREYIKDPKAKIPGTKMVYAGLKDEKRIGDLIAYLKQFDASGKKQ